jgi:NAD(P)-dependent dehydrogenase (short-subunit alcohol dehydrogenase family)
VKEGPVLAGRTALVTGSGRGIGQAIALALANVGADIAVHGTGDPAECDATARLVAATGRRTAVFRHDLGEPDAGRYLAETAVAALGQVDILVLNAADQIRKPWAELTQDDMERQYRINVAAAHASAAVLAPAMAERGWGRILAIVWCNRKLAGAGGDSDGPE